MTPDLAAVSELGLRANQRFDFGLFGQLHDAHDEGDSKEPGYEASVEGGALEDLADEEHEGRPGVVGWADAIEKADLEVVVRVVEVVDFEEPKGEEERGDDHKPSLLGVVGAE